MQEDVGGYFKSRNVGYLLSHSTMYMSPQCSSTRWPSSLCFRPPGSPWVKQTSYRLLLLPVRAKFRAHFRVSVALAMKNTSQLLNSNLKRFFEFSNLKRVRVFCFSKVNLFSAVWGSYVAYRKGDDSGDESSLHGESKICRVEEQFVPWGVIQATFEMPNLRRKDAYTSCLPSCCITQL